MDRVRFHPGSLDDSGLAWGPKAGDPEFAPGDRLDAYRLVHLIGEGGFGMVYLADQEEPVRRKVAIKLIKPGMDTRHVIARFQAERQAMALMDHPGVARIYDAGTTPAGRPYFVMEYVRGDPISTYCDQNRLNVPERLRLFMEVCDAVQYAHQKGIIHRDIKPSNVLITTDGPRPLPKVIDWGVARATQREEDRSRTLMTEAGQFVGTPEYMSPEQARIGPLDVDTRADIYSLGVLLYQLLAGELPFESKTLRQGTFVDVQRVIVEMQPPKPSIKLQRSTEASVTAGRRRTTPGTLGRMLRDDLDWIVMKAMDKERERRYSSAAELAADIRRHLLDEAVIAGAPSRWYRVRKLIKRNRGAFIAGSVALALLLTAFFVASGLYWRERRLARSLSEAIAQSRVRDQREAGLRAELERQRDEAAALAKDAQEARARAEWRAYLATVAAVEWARDIDPASAPAKLDAARRAGEGGLGGWELGVLASGLDHSLGLALAEPAAGVCVDSAHGPLVVLSDGRVVKPGDPGAVALAGFGGPVQGASFAAGPLVAAGREGGRVEVRALGAPGEPIFTAAHEGAWALAGDGSLLALAADSPRLVGLPEGADLGPWGELAGAQVLALSEDARVMATASFSGDVTLHEVESRRTTELPGADRQLPRCLAFSARGDALACAGDSGDIVIWPIEAGRVRFPARLRGHRGPVNALAFAAGGGFLVSASDDGTVRVWNLADLSLLVTLRGHTGPVRHVALGRTPAGLALVSAGDDGVRMWDLAAIRAREAGLALFAGAPVGVSVSGPVARVRLASGAIWMLDLLSATTEELRAADAVSASTLAVGPEGIVMREGSDLVHRGFAGDEQWRAAGVEGDLVAAGAGRIAAASGNVVTIADAAGMRQAHTLAGEVTSIIVDMGGDVIAGLRSGEVVELAEGEPRRIGAMVGAVTAVRRGDRGEILAGSELGEVLIESLGSAPRAWVAGRGAIGDLTMLAGERLLVADGAGDVTLWHAGRQEAVLTLQRGDAPVRAIIAMPGGESVLALRDDGTAAVWSAASVSPAFSPGDPGENLWLAALQPCDAQGVPMRPRAGEPCYLLVRGTVRGGGDVRGNFEVFIDGESVLSAAFDAPAEGSRTRPIEAIIGPIVVEKSGRVRLGVHAAPDDDQPWPGPVSDDAVEVSLMVAGGA